MSEAEFKQAADDVQKLPQKPGQADLLKLYALFKQASVGDVNTQRPGLMEFTGRAKWDAWEKVKGTTQEDARKQYIELVRSLEAKA